MIDDNDDYMDFLDQSELESEGVKLTESDKGDEPLPDWISEGNVSLAAYHVIETLKKERLLYIAKTNDKKKFTKKSNWTISKSEVARKLDVASQPLFYSATTTYSEGLLKHLDDTNKTLTKRKDAKTKSTKRGLGNRSKDDLISEFREQKEKLSHSAESNADELYRRFKLELPLDLKAKLQIKG
jgi:hypothetical protein